MARPRIRTETVTTGFRCSPVLHARITEAASKRDVSLNYLLTKAIEDYLPRLVPLDQLTGQGSLMKSKWAYGYEDGTEIMGGYGFLLAGSREEAESLAAGAVSEWFEEYGQPASVLVVWEMIPVKRGISLIIDGEDLGDGDQEPDEFDCVDWVEVGK